MAVRWQFVASVIMENFKEIVQYVLYFIRYMFAQGF